MSVVDIPELKAQFDEVLTHFKGELSKLRTGRASAALIENIMVNCYGTMMPMKQVGMINAPEARMLTVQVYDRNAVDAVVKAIHQADLGLNPASDGNLVRISVPALNEERRKEMVKALNKMAEENRVSVRNVRHKAIDVLKKQQKDKEISEDDLKRGQEEVQKLTDQYIADLDKALAVKEKEMMEV